jgi:uncharacterized protein YndB with AHSA1/START domain
MTTRAHITVTTPSDREIEITRDFAAPRSLVFDCYTRPELLKRWLTGPDGWSLVICHNDLTVGGAFHWVWRGPGGQDMGMGGHYREIVRPERIVRTERCDGTGPCTTTPCGETLGTLTLSEDAGRTTVTTTVLYASPQVRDAALASGMTRGVAGSAGRLTALLATLAPSAAPPAAA